MTVFIDYETDVQLDLPYETIIREVVEQAAETENCPYEVTVNVLLTDDPSIHEMNRDYRGIDRPTDVLSFPALELPAPADFSGIDEETGLDFDPDTGELLLGDIVISVEKVLSQAEEYGHSPRRELAFLVAHSMLHLFGFDHMEEDERLIMEEEQRKILNALDIHR